MRLASIAALAAGLAASAKTSADDVDDRADRLADAFIRSDQSRLAAAGRRLASKGLSELIAHKRTDVRLAAVAAAPHAEDAWHLLDDLAKLAAKADRQISPAAARTATRIAQSLDPERVATLEIAPAELRDRAKTWARVAAQQTQWADVRVHAIETNYLLSQTLPPDSRTDTTVDLNALTTDPEPEVRRAALELYPQPLDAPGRARAADVLRSDSDPVVAVVAGQALCGGIAMGDDASVILTELGPAGQSRARDLVGNATLPIAARLEAGQCLAAAATAPDIAALKRLVASAPKYATARARTLLKRARKK